MKITIDRTVVEQAQMWIPLLTEMAGLDPETTSAEFSEFADGRPASAFTIANVISALRAALEQPQVEQEPVAWQYRMRPDWGSKKDCWGPWQDCTMEQAAMYQRVPLLHDWAYESRQLYTHPQNLNCKSNQHRLATLWGYEKPQPPRQPLTDEQIDGILENVIGSLPVARKLIRAVEAAHGIGGEA